MSESTSGSEAYKVAGYLIMSDPDLQIIRYFKMLFNEVEKDMRTRVLVSKDLGVPQITKVGAAGG